MSENLKNNSEQNPDITPQIAGESLSEPQLAENQAAEIAAFETEAIAEEAIAEEAIAEEAIAAQPAEPPIEMAEPPTSDLRAEQEPLPAMSIPKEAPQPNPIPVTAPSTESQPQPAPVQNRPSPEQVDRLLLKEKEKKQGFKYFIRDVLSVVISAVVIAVLLRTFVIDSRLVPTESMYPTITGNDRVILLKFSYYFEDPLRGDVVVFESPAEMPDDSDLLKRVVGLPGDTLEVKEGQVFINGSPLDEPYLAEAPLYEYGPVEVPANSYFMLGDNRNRSNDSHIWQEPFIHEDDIKGKVILRYWPFERFGLIK